jgi:enamine deaminase RidA (YjgF/YER057c/UK114 family)
MIRRHSPWNGTLHEVVEHDGTLYFAGVVAEDTSLDMTGQMRSVTEQIDALLAANGSDRRHLLSVVIYVTDMAQKPAMNAVWKDWLDPADLPGRATIGVADLDGALVEVVVTAAVKR